MLILCWLYSLFVNCRVLMWSFCLSLWSFEFITSWIAGWVCLRDSHRWRCCLDAWKSVLFSNYTVLGGVGEMELLLTWSAAGGVKASLGRWASFMSNLGPSLMELCNDFCRVYFRSGYLTWFIRWDWLLNLSWVHIHLPSTSSLWMGCLFEGFNITNWHERVSRFFLLNISSVCVYIWINVKLRHFRDGNNADCRELRRN